jgi:phenylacetate-CoA ligase
MRDEVLHLYHKLPMPARRVAARMRGEYLRRWRYGRESEAIIAEAIEQETWSADRWRRWQADRLAFLLERAATRVPYYRDHWAARRRRGDRASWTDLENWPVLEKDTLRANPRAFLADDINPRRLFHEQTSGTTGKAIELWWSRELTRHIFGTAEAYCTHWYGVSRHDPWAMLGGQLIVPVAQRRPPFWIWNAALNQLYMSSYHLSPSFLPAYVDALGKHGIVHVAGYTSSVYQLALGVLASGRRDLKMAVAITNAEPVTSDQRRVISQAFDCQVCETYGMAEGVARASQCKAGTLHIWPQIGIIEIFEGPSRLRAGEPGDMVCTGLRNADMVLIRYRIGDRGTLADPSTRCACGRTLPILASIEGREEDTVYTRDGRAIRRFHAVFIGVPEVTEAQVIQETLNRVRIRCVPGPGFGASAQRAMIDKLRDRMGDVEVAFEVMDAIPRGANGKFRAVVCNLSRAERGALLQAVPAGSKEASFDHGIASSTGA